MKQKIAMMVSVLLGFFLIVQSVSITSQIDANPAKEPVISSAVTVSTMNAAHITEPTTLPSVQEYKGDLTDLRVIPKKPTVYSEAPVYSFQFLPNVTESFGFINVRKHQSNYLS